MLPSTTRILICTEPQDMRRSFDWLAQVTRELLGEEPQSGALYVFASKSRTRLKVLWWDRNGYCLLYKRLHQALFGIPDGVHDGSQILIDADALAELLRGVEKKVRAEKKSRNAGASNVFQLRPCQRQPPPPTPPRSRR